MNSYLVTWQINIEAESPTSAAIKALEIQRDIDSVATVFEVENTWNNELVQVDLDNPRIEHNAGWYTVHYWLDEQTYTHMKFDDYDEAVAFAASHP